MDDNSEDTLLEIEQNSDIFPCLQIGGNSYDEGAFYSKVSNDYDKLGTAIGNNTNLKKLTIDNFNSNVTLSTANEGFYEGIRHNSSITELNLHYIVCESHRQNITNVALEVLGGCQEKNILTKLHINTMPLVYTGDVFRFIEGLRGFKKLREFTSVHSRLTDDHLLPMVEAIRGHVSLERINLMNNNIGNTGCEALATLRKLTYLNIADNNIGNVGMIAFANSLSQNNCLRELNINDDYTGSLFDLRVVEDDFCRSLCNTSSINNIYSSNHTLETIPSYQNKGAKLVSLLKLNKSTRNKRHVAIKKILLYCPHIDMEPLFDLNVDEGDDSGQDLKALPHVISWFETAKQATIAETTREDGDSLSNDGSVSDEESEDEHTSSSGEPDEEREDEDDSFSGDDSVQDEESHYYNLQGRKLSAIYQFVTAMPMLFIPASRTYL